MSDGSNLADATHFIVPRNVANTVQEHLRACGRRGFEGMAFWAGTLEGRAPALNAVCRASLIPEQMGTRGEDGVAVMVHGDAIFAMNRWLHENRYLLLAQIHSHPGAAYHSETDDANALMTHVGGLSIVVPDFAEDDFDLQRLAVYRLAADGAWQHIPSKHVPELISLIDLR